MFYFVKYTPITMGDYQYPGWGEALGFLISLSSMIWVPGYMIYYFFTTPGSWREVWKQGTTPIIQPRAEAAKCKELKEIKIVQDDVEEKLLEEEGHKDYTEVAGSSSGSSSQTDLKDVTLRIDQQNSVKSIVEN